MKTQPVTQNQQIEETPSTANKQTFVQIPVWLWITLPTALGILAYVKAVPIISRDGPIAESGLHPWSMAYFGLFLGWSLLLNFRDGKWLGLLGAITWYGFFALLVVQKYHDFVLSNITDIRLARLIWFVPGALFAIYWVMSIINKMKHYIHPQKRQRILPRPLLLVGVLLFVWFLLNFFGVFDPNSQDFQSLIWTERFTRVGLVTLTGVFIPLLSALRYEWGDGKSFSFCLNLGLSYSFLLIFFIADYLAISLMIADLFSKVGIIVITIFMFIVLTVILALDAALFASLFFPKTAAKFAVDKGTLHKIWDKSPKQTKMKTAEPVKKEKAGSSPAYEPQKHETGERIIRTSMRSYPGFHYDLHPTSHYILGILIAFLSLAFYFFSTKMDMATSSGVIGQLMLELLAFGTLFLGFMLLFNTYTSRKERKLWLKNAHKAQTNIASRKIIVEKEDESLPEEEQYRKYFLQLEKIPDQLAVMPEESLVWTRVKESQFMKYEGMSSTDIYYSLEDPFTFLLEDEV